MALNRARDVSAADWLCRKVKNSCNFFTCGDTVFISGRSPYIYSLYLTFILRGCAEYEMIVTNEARSAELVIHILYPASPCLFYSGPKWSLTRVRKLVNKKKKEGRCEISRPKGRA